MSPKVEQSINQDRERTLLYSCLLSGWAPLTTGYAALLGKSILLFGDFLRRTGELIGLLLAWHTARRINQGKIQDSKQVQAAENRSSFIVALIMLFSSLIIGVASIQRFVNPQKTTNIFLGLFVAISGFLVNGYFFLRYTKLNNLKPGPILNSQRRLYYAKMFTDLAILITLILSRTLPAPFSLYMDPIGSVGITILLFVSGLGTLRDATA